MKQRTNRSPHGKLVAPEESGAAAPELCGFSTDEPIRSVPSDEDAPAETSEPTPDGESFSTADLFDVLSNRRRRYVVYLLKRATGPVELGTVATRIAAWENGREPSAVTGAERKRVYTSLQQVHLPKMDEFGAIRFDKRSGTIEPTSALANVTLDPDTRADESAPWDPWDVAYLLPPVLGIALGVAILLDVRPIVSVPTLVWMGSLIVSMLSVSVLRLYADTH